LWKLCGFRDEVPVEDRAGFEAALEAAGLLDAWVTPEGGLVDAATGDTIFAADDRSGREGLNRVLRPESELAEVVQAILGRIGQREGEGSTWITSDGRWHHGLLQGAWAKPAAEFLGHAAREQARHRRIAELETALAELDVVIETLKADLRRIGDRNSLLSEEQKRAPSTMALQRAAHTLESAVSASGEARERLDEADLQASRARDAENAARAERDRDAADLGLSNWKEPEALATLESLLNGVRISAIKYWSACEALARARTALRKAEAREQDAQIALTAANAQYNEARRLAAEAEARYATLHNTFGETAEQVLQRLAAVRAEIVSLERNQKSTDGRVTGLRVERMSLEKDEERILAERTSHEQARAEAVRRLQLFAEKRLLEEAGENLQPERTELAPNPAVELARRIEQALEAISSEEADWIRAQSGIQHQFSDLNDQLGMRGYHPQAELVDEGVFAVTCAFHGKAHTMIALQQSISGEMASREQMLDAREREIIENHLIGEVATELQTLIRDGEDWVTVANGELDRQPASSGIKLRFVWEVNAEAADGLDAARRQLLKTTTAWSPAERDSIGRFLHGRINAARVAEEAASWQDHLRTALDYRAWHRFGIMRFQDGQWKKLTKQTHGTGSGGEKALTLTLPQFAAAAAHYRSAAPFAPRLILLDEVFIGIDAPTRARLMGLINSFDLDFMMTSEREWGCYPTLPALAICQLASRPDSPAVHVTRWVWNGRKLVSHADGTPL
jgi:uncharacterized protein (TIGR02680 family)